ncbi:imidazole glycerol phosphate synthase subunit HisH [Pseudoroseomonas wenyumeiae]|uniref:Imidazole glycerol phosphate synthase subunit HisH n=1 Tax=Teichococcus wenyumeiae TaxID=2478470 RepID=A0A3A9J5L3_9PROT|nr:imidazole glycerol phosphate synthase subunit HisH [Pseudoroseomonas wenyumeiae]RKK01742.1 imidazole glycerol phosphate synthase subunit HisH [Pseudoroseomonas wenyumeiae]RMI27170.1 imidazole glycerol phosphate synthase subunit HisH [Pseudoroseomonas wenyumeiae]
MKVAVVDPGSGNLASVLRALRRAADEGGSGAAITVETRAEAVAQADAIVMPGQGAFAACRRGLDAMPGMVEAVDEAVTRRGIPFLGICVGMQLMVERGLEHGTTPGLGWIAGEMAPMDPRGLAGEPLPLPQMGWNGLRFAPGSHPVLAGLEPGDHAYFVHSYALSGGRPEQILATADYGGPVVAAIGRDNMFGTQFHVEKSQFVGLRMLANFLAWRP